MQEILNSNHFTRLSRVLFWLIAIGVIFMFAKTLNEFKRGSYIGRDVAAQNTITVSGRGEVLAKPDIATFSFSVTEEGKTVAEAQKKATNKINQAVDLTKKGGVNEKDIKTLGYNIYPKYEYYNQPQPRICYESYCPPQPVKDPKIIGYEVSQTIEVKVRKIEDSGDLLSTVGSIGVTNISGLSFSIDDEEKVKQEAQEKAIKEAKDKADKLAKQLGVSIVRVSNFSESGNYPIYYGRGGAFDAKVVNVAESAPSPQIPSGENQIISNVTITYEIR